VSLLEQERELLERERDLLQRELERAEQREQVALERERAAREREALLLHMLEQAQQQSQRLLPAPQSSPAFRRPTTLPSVWQQVLAHMHSHQSPHRPYEIQTALGASYTVRHVMRRMADAGVIQRVEPGVYVLAEESASRE